MTQATADVDRAPTEPVGQQARQRAQRGVDQQRDRAEDARAVVPAPLPGREAFTKYVAR